MILTTEAIARGTDHGNTALPCTECFGGNGVQYDFPYTDDGEVIP
jgi:hypothetical protein